MSLTGAKLLTAEDLWNMPQHGGHNELVRGELRPMAPAGGEHGATIINLTLLIGNFVKQHKLGYVFAAETGFVLSRDPDTVRAADVGFVSKSRITGEVPKQFVPLAPDLAVEVISPWDKVYEVEEKAEDWIAGGVRLLWVVNPKTRTVKVYKPNSEPVILNANQQLSGEDILPGFSIPIADIFC